MPAPAPGVDVEALRQQARFAEQNGNASGALDLWNQILQYLPADPEASAAAENARRVVGAPDARAAAASSYPTGGLSTPVAPPPGSTPVAPAPGGFPPVGGPPPQVGLAPHGGAPTPAGFPPPSGYPPPVGAAPSSGGGVIPPPGVPGSQPGASLNPGPATSAFANAAFPGALGAPAAPASPAAPALAPGQNPLDVANAYLAERRYAEAAPLLEQAAEAAGTDEALFRQLGLTRGLLGDTAGAQRAFTRCVQLIGKDIEGFRRLAFTALRAGQKDLAVDAVVTFLTNQPEEPRGYSLLGTIYAELGREKDALEAFENAASLAPQDPQVLAELGRSLLDANQLPRAEQVLQAASELDPSLAAAWAYRGDLRRMQGDHGGARTAYEKAAMLDQNSIAAGLGMSLLFEEQGKRHEAAAALRELLALAPEDRRLQVALLRTLAKGGQPQVALQVASEILANDPMNLVARIYKGISFYEIRDYPAALGALEGVLEEAVDDPRVLLHLGLTYFQLQRYEEAVESLEEAVRYAPTLVEAYLHLGYGYRNLGNGMDAALNFTKVLNLEPDNEAAKEGMMSLG